MTHETSSKRTFHVLSLSVVVILLALVCGGRVVPIYDGVGFPDEPYRYVNPPANSPPTPAPTVGEAVTAMNSGSNPGYIDIASLEQGPQITFYLAPQSALVDHGVTSLDIQARPKAPAATDNPANGTIVGNIYTIVGDHPVTFRDKSRTSAMSLRIPVSGQSGGKPLIEYRAGSNEAWRPLETMQAGNDIYQSAFVGFGDYTMVVLKSTPGSAAQLTLRKTASSHIVRTSVTIVANVLLLLVVIIIGIRVAERHKQKTKHAKRRS